MGCGLSTPDPGLRHSNAELSSGEQMRLGGEIPQSSVTRGVAIDRSSERCRWKAYEETNGRAFTLGLVAVFRHLWNLFWSRGQDKLQGGKSRSWFLATSSAGNLKLTNTEALPRAWPLLFDSPRYVLWYPY
jgi:hypothetical protein